MIKISRGFIAALGGIGMTLLAWFGSWAWPGWPASLALDVLTVLAVCAGAFFFLAGDMESAAAAFGNTLKLDPDIRARYLLGRALNEKGNFAAARQALQAVPRDDPEYAAAQRLLAETSMPIGEVAAQSGFQDMFYFSRRFRLESGLSPTQYRKRYRFN